MSITQSFFLHTPANHQSIIKAFVETHIAEGEQLDFKGYPGWSDPVKACASVAAFANHLGGDIVIGIDDVDDCASDWKPIPNAEIAEKEDTFTKWLKSYLHPREFVQTVRMVRLPANEPGYSVLVVSVPPYPELVGIEKSGNHKDGIDFRFPTRVGKTTRWLIFEEIMKRVSDSTRGTYFKLKSIELKLGNGAPVRFSNPVLIPYNDSYVEGALDQGSHGVLVGVYEDIIIVEIKVVDTGNNNLAIPLELIRSMWVQPRNGMTPLLSFALDAKIVLGDSRWRLFTSV